VAPGITVTQSGTASCTTWCAYHGTIDVTSFKIPNVPYLYYGVIPDQSQSGPCWGKCGGGYSYSDFENTCVVASHEIIETATDPGVEAATYLGPPLAYYDTANGEISDMCLSSGTNMYAQNIKYFH
jgi:hypothetical protein